MKGQYPATLIAALLVAACTDEIAKPLAPLPDNALLARGGNAPHGGGIPHSIAFPTARDGNREIYVMNADGSEQTRLTVHPAEDFNPAWSPDGRKIVFVSNRDGNAEIYVMGADSPDTPVNLTGHSAAENGPVFSPDGKRIAFMSDRDRNFEIYAMNADGSDQTRLTNHLGPDMWPDWSPNGRQIVFQRDRDIHVLDIATGGVTRLTTDPAFDDMPVFSPNGRRIAFMSRRDGYAAIYVMEADGTNPVNVTPKPDPVVAANWAMFPEWSKNGRQIYFLSTRPETGTQSDVFVMDADGSGVMQLTTDPALDGAPAVR